MKDEKKVDTLQKVEYLRKKGKVKQTRYYYDTFRGKI